MVCYGEIWKKDSDVIRKEIICKPFKQRRKKRLGVGMAARSTTVDQGLPLEKEEGSCKQRWGAGQYTDKQVESIVRGHGDDSFCGVPGVMSYFNCCVIVHPWMRP